MPKHHTNLVTDFSSEDLFNLVLDIQSYPEFLPWCKSAEIIKQTDNIIIAKLNIEFKNINESYTSKVTFEKYNAINVEMVEGPFKFLHNKWQFTKLTSGKTLLTFVIDFQFSSYIMDKLIGIFFDKAVEKMALAFIQRANNTLNIPKLKD
jgi:coenzyme Q-binding protein COQ10